MDECQAHWVAGIIEGEGCFHLQAARTGDPKVYPQVTVGMTDLDVLERLQDYTGMGKIRGPYMQTSGNPAKKPAWLWRVSNSEDSVELLTRIAPLMCSRRQGKIAEVVEAWKTRPNQRVNRRGYRGYTPPQGA